MRPGLIERREAEYTRHGTQVLIGNLEVATGQVIAPTVQQTRGEVDFANHIKQNRSDRSRGGLGLCGRQFDNALFGDVGAFDRGFMRR